HHRRVFRGLTVSAKYSAGLVAGARNQRSTCRNPLVLRIAPRRRSVSQLYPGARRERSARRTQPAVLRRAGLRGTGIHIRLAQRSGEFRKLSVVFSRPRSCAPVVGTSGRLEELSRAMVERGVCPVLCGGLRG